MIGILIIVLHSFFFALGAGIFSDLHYSLWFYGLDLAEIERPDFNYEADDVLGAREPIKASLVRLNNAQGRGTFT